MKYLIRAFFVLIVSVPILASAQEFNFIVCDPAAGKECSFSSVLELANTIIKFLIVMGTSVFSFMFMWAGYLYLTALGNTGQISKAHSIFWDAIIGFVIMLAAWLFIDFIFTALGVKPDFKLLGK